VPIGPLAVRRADRCEAGFDCTKPIGKNRPFEFSSLKPPECHLLKRRGGLEAGPASFIELMRCRRPRSDGRGVVRDLEPFYAEGRIRREDDALPARIVSTAP